MRACDAYLLGQVLKCFLHVHVAIVVFELFLALCLKFVFVDLSFNLLEERESILDQYLATVRPSHEQFIEPSKRFADVIVPEGGLNRPALEVLLARVREIAFGD